MAHTQCHYSERALKNSPLCLCAWLRYTDVQGKGSLFLPPPGGLLLHLQHTWNFQLDSPIYSLRWLDFLTASPKENLCNSTEDVSCQDQDKIS